MSQVGRALFVGAVACAAGWGTLTGQEESLGELRRVSGVPGLQVTLIDGGAVAWTGSTGVRSLETGTPVTSETVFEAASLSKPVFGYVVLQLVDQGILDLDRPLTEYYTWEDLAHDHRVAAVTTRMVLSHSSGLPNWRPNDGALTFVHEPGTTFQYSGEGFVYLQAVVEHVTGESLEALAERLVFDPLGMPHSSFRWSNTPEADVAVGHRRDGTARDKREIGDNANAAWSLHTTTEDFARFLIAVMNGERLSDSLGAALSRPHIDVDSGVHWGLGWGIEDTPARGPGLWHWGHNGGYRAFVVGYPRDRSGVVMFSNSDDGMLVLEDLLESTVGPDHPAVVWLDYESWDSPGRLARIELHTVILTDGIEAGIERFRLLRQDNPAAFEESTLNTLGYDLLRAGHVAEAIIIFQMNVALYPAAFNTYDSLGEAYFEAGDLDRALANYRRSVRLNPENGNGVMMIERIQRAQRASG